jgi:hypothetical protein
MHSDSGPASLARQDSDAPSCTSPTVVSTQTAQVGDNTVLLEILTCPSGLATNPVAAPNPVGLHADFTVSPAGYGLGNILCELLPIIFCPPQPYKPTKPTPPVKTTATKTTTVVKTATTTTTKTDTTTATVVQTYTTTDTVTTVVTATPTPTPSPADVCGVICRRRVIYAPGGVLTVLTCRQRVLRRAGPTSA